MNRSTKRKKINPTDEANLLMACRRRCCLCAHYKSDYSRKKGQIAHIDKDRSNAAISNLAFLCLDCHDTYDSTSSQSKNFTQKEVRLCKDKLESHYSDDSKLQVTISLTLDISRDQFEIRQDEIRDAISGSVGREVEAMNLQFVNETVEMTLDNAETLQFVQSTNDGRFGDFQIESFEISDVRSESSYALPAFSAYFGEEYLDEFVSEATIVKTFQSSTCQAHLDAQGSSCRYDESTLSIFVKHFGEGRRRFAVVVFVVRHETSTNKLFHPAIRLYRKEFEYSDSWSALDYATAFAAKYGINIRPLGKRLILPMDNISGLHINSDTLAFTSFRGPYHYIAFHRKDFLGITHVYFLLSVDVIKYAKSLRGHGLRLPKTFKKKLRTKDRYTTEI